MDSHGWVHLVKERLDVKSFAAPIAVSYPTVKKTEAWPDSWPKHVQLYLQKKAIVSTGTQKIEKFRIKLIGGKSCV